MGYLGDIAAAILLDVDPYDMFCDMIDATDGLSHRDQSDIVFNNYNVDAKIEDFGDYHSRVLASKQSPVDPYGCRLINLDQYEQNKGSTDIYLFGCFDPPQSETRLIHDISSVLWLGWVDSDYVETCFGGGFVPGGNRLPAWAKQIPHNSLRPIDELLQVRNGPRKAPAKKHKPDPATAARIHNLKEALRGLMR